MRKRLLGLYAKWWWRREARRYPAHLSDKQVAWVHAHRDGQADG